MQSRNLKCRLSNAAQYRWLKGRFEAAKSAVEAARFVDDPNGIWAAEYFLALADCASPCWPLITEVKQAGDIDRRGSLIGGPLYTSRDHAWPVHNSIYATPIIQISLDELSWLSGFPLGDGVLQLWAHSNGTRLEIRLLGPDDIFEEPDEPPYLLCDYNYASDLEYNSRARPRWIAEGALQIISYGEIKFAVPYYQIGNLLDDMVDSLSGSGQQRIAARLKRLDRNKPFLQDNDGVFAFGTFDRWTYGPDECPPALLCLGGGLPFWFSENGNLQIFFAFDASGEAHFSAAWSVMT